jgi:hypothetical protein
MGRSAIKAVLLGSVLGAAMLAPTSASAAIGWSAPVSIDSHAGQNTLTSISCPSSSFCMAVDDGGNNYDGHGLIFNGSSWSARNVIDTAGQYGPYSVSCTSSSFCAAFDGSENGLIYNGSSWQATVVSQNAPYPISCVSSSFCMIGPYGYDGSWSPAQTYYTGGGAPAPMGGDSESILSISCPSTSFCAAVGHNGGADTYNGGGWTNGSYNGSGWTYDGLIDTTGGVNSLNSVSCPSASFCVAVDGNGNVFYWNGSSWSGPNTIDLNGQGLSSVSCPSPSFCVAVDGTGNALMYNGSAWSYKSIDPYGQGLTAVSCASSSFCMALDTVGNAVEYGPVAPLGSAALVGHPRATANGVTATISCTGSTSCVVTEKLTTIEHIVHGRLVAVSASSHARNVVVGTKTVTIAAGHTATTTVKLNSVGRRLFRAFGKLPVRYAITMSRSGHTIVVAKRTVTIKRHKK